MKEIKTIEIIETNIILSPILKLSSGGTWESLDDSKKVETIKLERFFNPITFELIGSWLDGIYMQPNLFSKEHEVNYPPTA